MKFRLRFSLESQLSHLISSYMVYRWQITRCSQTPFLIYELERRIPLRTSEILLSSSNPTLAQVYH